MKRRSIIGALCGLGLVAIVLCVGLIRQTKYGDGPIDVETLGSFELDPVKGSLQDIPERFRQLDGRRVVIRGDMWEPMSSGGEWVDRFDLTRLSEHREFQVPRVQDYVKCSIVPDQHVPFYSEQIEATGTFHVAVRRDAGDRSDRIWSVFSMDVEAVKSSPVDYTERDLRVVVTCFGVMIAVLLALLSRDRVARFLMLNPGGGRASLRDGH